MRLLFYYRMPRRNKLLPSNQTLCDHYKLQTTSLRIRHVCRVFGVRHMAGLCFTAAGKASETLTDDAGGDCHINPAHFSYYV